MPSALIRSEPSERHNEPGEVVLKAEGLSKIFGSVHALNNVSITLRSGEIRAICGENGAGKSTLVKILTGIVQSDSGSMELGGITRLISSPRDAQSRGINLVSQELSVCPDLSVLDNIWLGTIGVPFLHRRRALRQQAKAVLAELGADTVGLDAPLSSLGTGERQIVEIARMLNRETDILILDEPTATLSDQEIGKVLKALRVVRDKGKSLVYITHRLSEVFELCDTATIMRNGETVADCRVKDLDSKSLVELMLGRPLGEMYPAHQSLDAENDVLSARDLCIPAAVGPIEFAVPSGKIVCLTGQLGSGAEDIARAVCGLVHDVRGDVSIAGARLVLGRPEQAFAAGVRFVSGDRATEGVFVQQSVLANLVATRLSRRSVMGTISPKTLRKEAAGLAEAVQIDRNRLDSTVVDLSGGNQQKIAFGRNVSDPDAKVLVMIEPTRGIDVGARAEIYRLMRSFCDQGYGILVASTDFGEVLGLGDIILTMYRGKIVGRHAGSSATMPQIIADVTHPEGK